MKDSNKLFTQIDQMNTAIGENIRKKECVIFNQDDARLPTSVITLANCYNMAAKFNSRELNT